VALKDKSAPALAVHLVARRGGLLKSTATERQLFEVLGRPHLALLIAPAAREWLTQLLATAEPVTITERIVACRDPTDDKFLELAVNGHADFIVSGDADLLVLNPFRGIPIITPDRYRHAVAT
jgi:putative PIN family toxin of toxin-antitoxin system